MAQITREQMKDKWVTGYRPQEGDYDELFDSVYVKNNEPASGLGTVIFQSPTEPTMGEVPANGLWMDTSAPAFLVGGSARTQTFNETIDAGSSGTPEFNPTVIDGGGA